MSNKTTVDKNGDITSVTTGGNVTVETTITRKNGGIAIEESLKKVNPEYPDEFTTINTKAAIGVPEVYYGSTGVMSGREISTGDTISYVRHGGTNYAILTDPTTGKTQAAKSTKREALTDNYDRFPLPWESLVKDANGTEKIESSIPFGSNKGWEKTTVVNDETPTSKQEAAVGIRMAFEAILDRDEAMGGKLRQALLDGKVPVHPQVKANLPKGSKLATYQDIEGGYGDAPARPEVPNNKPAPAKGAGRTGG